MDKQYMRFIKDSYFRTWLWGFAILFSQCETSNPPSIRSDGQIQEFSFSCDSGEKIHCQLEQKSDLFFYQCLSGNIKSQICGFSTEQCAFFSETNPKWSLGLAAFEWKENTPTHIQIDRNSSPKGSNCYRHITVSWDSALPSF